jgi:hypothetical protein
MRGSEPQPPGQKGRVLSESKRAQSAERDTGGDERRGLDAREQFVNIAVR